MDIYSILIFGLKYGHKCHKSRISCPLQGAYLTSIVRLKKELKQFMKLDELTPEMVHRFVDKIEVQADGSVNIHYKFTTTALLTA